MVKRYNIQRDDLIKNHLDIVIRKLDLDQVVNDLIKGGEFILTADDILSELDTIPGPAVGTLKCVKAEECGIVYNKKLIELKVDEG
jgi:hypothetical protein